jgi:hypothetical protein
MKNPIIIVALIVMMIIAIGLYFSRSAFAMHDSAMDVNTWIASNNSTQLHTIDLNKGPVIPTAATGTTTTPEETTDESIEEDTSSTADENGDETTASNGDEDEDDDGSTIFEDESREDD